MAQKSGERWARIAILNGHFLYIKLQGCGFCLPLDVLRSVCAMEMPVTGGPRVLVSDDEELVAKTLVAILNKSGFSARATFDGGSAVAAASEWRPDILLCDVIMPEMDGIETAIRIREVLPSCRVFLISAQEREAARVAEQKARGYDFEFILKPIHPLELIQLLRFALQESR